MIHIEEAQKLNIDPDKITAFIEREWKRQITLSLPWFYAWQFQHSPTNDGKDRSIVVVDDDGVQGFMGLNTRNFFLDGQCVKGAELTTWMISEKVRGQGYAKKMLALLKEKYDVLVGMGITEMAVPVYTQLDFKYLRHIPRFVRIFNVEQIKTFSQISELGLKLIEKHRSLPRVDYHANRVYLNKTGASTQFLHHHFNCFSRETEYLEWRYLHHPVYHYETFHVESGSGTAVVILRIEQKESLKIVHVIDIYPKDLSVLPAVICFLEDFGRKTNADFSDFFCTTDHLGHVFWELGWFSMLNDYFVQIPSLYYPIELRIPPTTSMAIWARPNMRSLLDLGRLYITKGDCDLDRPTVQYLQEKEEQRSA